MRSFFTRSSEAKAPPPEERPKLELSGPLLKAGVEFLVKSCESAGGVERYVEALKFKSSFFREAFDEKGKNLDAERFAKLCMFMPTVRRRIEAYLESDGKFAELHVAIRGIFEAGSTDEAIAGFCAAFPNDKKHRWVRDLAAEILHNCDPERQPLMCRWVWDRKANTGVIREVWHGNVDHLNIDVDDDAETFIMLREELSQFLTENGMYRDVIWYVDLLCGQIYATYVSSQGGTYLRTDFASEEDQGVILRRLLGLDGVPAKCARFGGADLEGSAERVDPLKLITRH